MLRVAAYCRVSTDRDDQKNSLENQREFFKRYIDHQPDWVLWNVYADSGRSGTSTARREAFVSMIGAAQAGQIDLILTKEVSRFARNTVDTLCYTRQLRRLGVGVIFLNDRIDTRSQEGEFRLTLMSSIAQEESRKTSQRVKFGQTVRMKEGVVFGPPLLGYEVCNGTLIVEPKGAAVVRFIFQKYVQEGCGSSTIAKLLQSRGIRSSRGVCRWSASTVLKILKNEKYCGDLVQKKTYTPDYLTHQKRYNHGEEEKIVLCQHHLPIIDRQTWQLAQEKLRARRKNAEQNKRSAPD